MTVAIVTGEFKTLEASAPVSLYQKYNMSISGSFSAEVQLERSFDKGLTWHVLETVTAPRQHIGEEPETGILYRVRCSRYSDGPVHYRLSQ
ncbi:MAG: hypothetical protein H6905_03430 [Hyphomicrobiales bacterium]|nr:hypothetical protein [Hyphomicrobiales bacterium]